ncbi:MAG: hypothetical protein WCD81_08590 [Candidatus Bathyarchaeia archaeon]
MSRGLGELQRRIIERLKVRKPEDGMFYHFETSLSLERTVDNGWHSLGNLIGEVQDDSATHNIEGKDYDWSKLTVSDRQSFWRAIRNLEKKHLIESQFFERMSLHRVCSDEHRRGGVSRVKAIRLVHIRHTYELNS